MQNVRWHRKNHKAPAVGNVAAGVTALYPVAKTIPGAGPGFAFLVALPAPVPIPPVGTFAGPPFPATVGDLHALTVFQLHQLAAFYNDTFGIVPADSPEEKNSKFQAYILGE